MFLSHQSFSLLLHGAQELRKLLQGLGCQRNDAPHEQNVERFITFDMFFNLRSWWFRPLSASSPHLYWLHHQSQHLQCIQTGTPAETGRSAGRREKGLKRKTESVIDLFKTNTTSFSSASHVHNTLLIHAVHWVHCSYFSGKQQHCNKLFAHHPLLRHEVSKSHVHKLVPHPAANSSQPFSHKTVFTCPNTSIAQFNTTFYSLKRCTKTWHNEEVFLTHIPVILICTPAVVRD